MLFSVEQAFVGRDEIRAPLKTSAWEATCQSVSLFDTLKRKSPSPSTAPMVYVFKKQMTVHSCKISVRDKSLSAKR